MFLRDPNKPIFTNKLNLFIMKKVFLFAIAALMSASMFAATEISCADAKAKIDAGDKNEWTVVGYVTAIQEPPSPVYNSLSIWMADAADGGKVFEVYGLGYGESKLNIAPDDLPVIGDKIAVTTTLKKYTPTSGSPVYETDKISAFAQKQKCDCIRYTEANMTPVKFNSVAEAYQWGLDNLKAGEFSMQSYEVAGYIVGFAKNGAWKDNKASFYMNDEVGVKSNFEGYKTVINESVEAGDYVKVSGWLQRYDGADFTTIEFVNGKGEKTVQAINNVNAESVKAMKVIEDGQLFIIRNGVKYNAAGAIVK